MKIEQSAIKSGLLATALLLAAGGVFGDSVATRAYQDALKNYGEGHHDAALQQLQMALQLDPGQVTAKVLLGKTLLAIGDPMGAVAALEEASNLGGESAQIMLPLARARNQLGHYKRNIETLRPPEMAPDIASDLWVELGISRLALNKPASAQAAFEKAMELRPGNIGARLGQVSLLKERQDLKAAEALCDQILDSAPDNADAWYLKGSLLEARHQLAEAEAHLDRSLELNPNHLKARLAMAIVTLNSGRAPEAISRFQELFEDQPWSLESAYLLSQALGVNGQLTAAKKALEHAADIVASQSPDDLVGNPRLLLISSLVTYDTEDIDASLRFLRGYLQHKPQDFQARKQLAKLLSITGKSHQAIGELHKLISKRPRDPQLHIMLGDINVQIGDYMQAEGHYATALDIGTPSAKLIAKVGIAQTGRGRSDLAIDTMQRLVDLAPGKSAGASIFLGILYLHEGDLEAAHSIADQIVAHTPEHLLAINLQAVVAVARGDYKVGRALFNKALDFDPDFDPARVNLIKLDIVEERYQQARQTLDTLIEREPDNISILRAFAELHMVLAEYREAAQRLERIRSLAPDSVRNILLLSQVYERMNQPQAALDTVLALENFAPDDLAVQLRLAEIQLQRGKREEALSYLRLAAQLAGDHLGRRLAVARVQIAAGAFDAANQSIQDALSENPDAPEPRLLLGKIDALQGRWAQADKTISAVLQTHPRHARASALLGDIRLERGQTQDALSLYRKALQLDDSATNALRLHRARISAGQTRMAYEGLAAWHRKRPGNETVMAVLADHYAQAGQRAKALALYRGILDANPESVAAHNNLALALLPLDRERALMAALGAYRLDPTNAAVLDTLGWIEVLNGDLETGLSRLREALKHTDEAAQIHYHLAVALEKRGDLRGARQALRQALKQQGPFPERSKAEQRLQWLTREQPK